MTGGRPSISIAMTSFNGARFLLPQLESLSRQSVLPLELVVGDNGSNDASLDMLEEFQRRAPFPVLITRNPGNLGCAANFIAVAQRCRGDLIAFCDQDDVWHPEKLRIMVEAFDRPDILLAFHNCHLVDAAGHDLGMEYHMPDRLFAPLTIDPWRPIYGHSQVMRQGLVKWAFWHPQTVNPADWEQPMAHDMFFVFWASILGFISYRKDVLVDYRQHGGNLTGMLPQGWPARAWRDITHTHRFAVSKVAATRQRIAMLEQMASQASGIERQRLSEALEYHRQLLPFVVRRARLYDGSHYGQRLWAFLQNFFRGGYTTSRSWGFGLGGLAQDFLLGLLWGPYLKHLNRGSETASGGEKWPRNRPASPAGD